MTIGRKASRLVVAIKPAPVVQNTSVVVGTYDGYIRVVLDLPPANPNNEHHLIIRPFGKTQPASVLTCLLKSNHPRILDYDGVRLRHNYEDAYSEKAKQHVRRFDGWCSDEWIPKSKKYGANRFSSKFKPHKGDFQLHGYYKSKNAYQQNLISKQTSEEVNRIHAWAHTHEGVDKSTPLIINTAEATKCLVCVCSHSSTKKINIDNYYYLDSIFGRDLCYSTSLYDCSSGKPHGIVSDIEVIFEVRAPGTSLAALEHHRESKKTQRAESYANNLLAWGVEIPPPSVQSPSCSLSPPVTPQKSTIQILENSKEPPPLCAQQETNPSSFHEHIIASSIPAASVPVVDDEGIFGGFFSQSRGGELSVSLLSS
ncbi:hypothetical protein ZWY2020_034561 [Hordeum vulgare]|nr:hypothetical protein ZWY2020_034561 [Hordeum vulgare]